VSRRWGSACRAGCGRSACCFGLPETASNRVRQPCDAAGLHRNGHSVIALDATELYLAGVNPLGASVCSPALWAAVEHVATANAPVSARSTPWPTIDHRSNRDNGFVRLHLGPRSRAAADLHRLTRDARGTIDESNVAAAGSTPGFRSESIRALCWSTRRLLRFAETSSHARASRFELKRRPGPARSEPGRPVSRGCSGPVPFLDHLIPRCL
jgi:hypothetical protein